MPALSPNQISRLGLVYYPDPALKKRCRPVTDFGNGLRALADRMIDLMIEHKGVGLAAPQVGLQQRVFVCSPTGERENTMVCVNPKLVELEGAETREEGCLSIPSVYVKMRRARRAVIEALDAEGKPFRLEATDMLARIWQHESDHLDGKLIIDNMSEADEIANRRAIKHLKDSYKPRK